MDIIQFFFSAQIVRIFIKITICHQVCPSLSNNFELSKESKFYYILPEINRILIAAFYLLNSLL